jgi:thioredoxin
MNKTNFNNFLKNFENQSNKWIYTGEEPVILDFFADWCVPCKNLEPAINDLSEKYKNVKFYKVNIEEESKMVEMFSIKSIPTLIFLNKNLEPIIETGSISKVKMENNIKKIINEPVLV